MITLLRLPAVLAATGLSRSMLYELLEKGAFPRPVKLGGGRINAWSETEVSEWIEGRLAQRVAA